MRITRAEYLDALEALVSLETPTVDAESCGHCCVESDLAAMDRAAVPCLVRWFGRVR